VKGYAPPESAIYKNPYREWIGAQIRGDYFGYINPGNPERAAEMAWRDASISHIKNGIYGEMFAAAMIACAAVTADVEQIIEGGLGEIPYTSRLYEDVQSVLEVYRSGASQKACFDLIHSRYDEYSQHGWCHTNSNAMIVAASLLYGGGDYGKSICMAVETGFDTDCNGATVGSVLGMANGIQSISDYWTNPIQDTLHTTIFGVGTVKISDRVKLTMEHIAGK
jgi:ADP-ribosylglycohydrolase